MGGTVLSYNSDKAVEEAIKETEKLNDALISKLLKDKRYEDLEKCTLDKSYKKVLLMEYKLLV